jgi:hypothetical protein
MGQMSRAAKPQPQRFATATLDGFGMPKIVKPTRPLLVAGDDITCGRRCGGPLHIIGADTRGPLRRRLSQDALDDLGPGTLGTSSAMAGSPPSITQETSIRARRSELIMA